MTKSTEAFMTNSKLSSWKLVLNNLRSQSLYQALGWNPHLKPGARISCLEPSLCYNKRMWHHHFSTLCKRKKGVHIIQDKTPRIPRLKSPEVREDHIHNQAWVICRCLMTERVRFVSMWKHLYITWWCLQLSDSDILSNHEWRPSKDVNTSVTNQNSY